MILSIGNDTSAFGERSKYNLEIERDPATETAAGRGVASSVDLPKLDPKP